MRSVGELKEKVNYVYGRGEISWTSLSFSPSFDYSLMFQPEFVSIRKKV